MTDDLDNYLYTEKRKKADKIAKRLINSTDLGRIIELEVLDEEDKALADLVRNVLSKLHEAQLASGIKTVKNIEDLNKLPSGDKIAIKEYLDQMGGQLPPGGLFQVQLRSVKGLDAAVDTVVTTGAVNLASLIISRLAAVRASAVSDAIEWLVSHAHKLQAELTELKGSFEVTATATLKRIDEVVAATFSEHNYDVAIELHKELKDAHEEKSGKKSKQSSTYSRDD